MNNYFRRTLHGLACALAFACGSFAWASPAEVIRFVTDTGWHDTYAYADSQFRAELAYHAQLPPAELASVNADLRRDSHGFRQAAADEFEISAPTDH